MLLDDDEAVGLIKTLGVVGLLVRAVWQEVESLLEQVVFCATKAEVESFRDSVKEALLPTRQLLAACKSAKACRMLNVDSPVIAPEKLLSTMLVLRAARGIVET